ncbi:PREDICTED: lysine-specific demethylase 8-like [Priapulus caudatus]|uniref:JmjC domain-containing protein 5 n=1 Tax=Priapulus caudatus TaxID=37621 RepID=A0ABM1F2S0_PRICU|nr:PREDICTED: lysine-specific demethylase 8-like [Priapulus caudatus]
MEEDKAKKDVEKEEEKEKRVKEGKDGENMEEDEGNKEKMKEKREEEEAWEEGLRLSQCLLDITWEQLNTGPWRDVDVCWRQLYTCASLVKATCQLIAATRGGNDDDDDDDDEIMKRLCCDKSCRSSNHSGGGDRGGSSSVAGNGDAGDDVTVDRLCGSGNSSSSNNNNRGSSSSSGGVVTATASALERMLREVIRTCDMGLLLGAPLLNNALARLVTALCHMLQPVGAAEAAAKTTPPGGAGEARKETSPELEPSVPRKKPRLDSKNDGTEGGRGGGGGGRERERGGGRGSGSSGSSDIIIDPARAVPRVSAPSLESFSRYLRSRRPVVITAAMQHWPATRRWSAPYLRRVAGPRTVPVEIGRRYTDDTWTQKLMTVDEFVSRHLEGAGGGDDDDGVGYLAQHQLFDQIPELRRDIVVPDYCCARCHDDDEDEDVDVNAWIGPRGTVSPLHHDPKHNLLAQVVGRKYVRLYAPDQSPRLYPHDGALLGNTSRVDAERPDAAEFPLFGDAEYEECVLEAGEMLYLPPRHWHYVRSLQLSFSVEV